MAPRTSSALPTSRPNTWFMSVISARVRRPAPPATSTMLRASSWPNSGVAAKAPLPHLMSIARPCSPAASFFDRMLAVISGTLSTVAVMSRTA